MRAGRPIRRPRFTSHSAVRCSLTPGSSKRLLASPDKSLVLLPGGKATAEKLTSLEIGDGAKKKTVTAWAVSGLGNSPLPIWTDAKNKFFGLALGMSWLPDGYESERAKLEKAQGDALAARMPALARSLAKMPSTPVAFTNVKLFDADGLRFLDDQTVVVDKGVIVSVGPAAEVKPPAGAQIIDGKGKTLVPGMWDCHMHVGDDYTGLQELSLGVTSVRDPGNDDTRTIDRRDRAAKGDLLAPHVYPSSLIDGKGPYTAQVANVATSQAEAIAWVRKAKEKGFTGVKFYGTLNPAWLKASIAEAHKLGLHVHGHLPAGIRPMDAIKAGYDEITHINWIIMQAMPDDVVKVSNGIMRFEGPGRYARNVDLDAAPMKTLVATMAAKKISSDPTMVAFEGLYVPENGDLSPAYAPFVGTLPPATERGFRSGGFAVPKDLTRADYRASWAKLRSTARQNVSSWRADRCRDRRVGHRNRPRTGNLPRSWPDPGGSAGGGDDHARPPRRPGEEDRIDQGRQERRHGAGRRRSLGPSRRFAPDPRRHDGRQTDGCRRAPHRRRILRPAEVSCSRVPVGRARVARRATATGEASELIPRVCLAPSARFHWQSGQRPRNCIQSGSAPKARFKWTFLVASCCTTT